jgi:hypothetical protein
MVMAMSIHISVFFGFNQLAASISKGGMTSWGHFQDGNNLLVKFGI